MNEDAVTVRMAPGEHAHDYDLGHGWTACPDGDGCRRYPRDIHVNETRSPDGTVRSASARTIRTEADLIADGLLSAAGVFSFAGLLATDPQRPLAALAADLERAEVELRQSIRLLVPILYPDKTT